MPAFQRLYRIISSGVFLLALMLLCTFAPLAWRVLSGGLTDLPNAGDAALLELSTRNVFREGILVGPYSRFGFFHPGPLYFQLRHPLYVLMGKANSSFILVTVLILAGCLFSAWKAAASASGNGASIVFTASAALFLLSVDKAVWLSEWNPYIVMMPLAAFVVCTAAAVSRRPACLLPAVLAGSLAAQTHIAVAPSIIAVSLLAAVYAIRGRAGAGRYMHWSIGLFLLLWAAPLYQQLSAPSGEGNFSAITAFFSQSKPDVAPGQAFTAWAEMATALEMPGESFGLAARILLITVRLILSGAAFVLLQRRGQAGFSGFMVLCCIILHIVSWYSVTQIRGQLDRYLIQWVAVVPMLSLFALGAASWRLWGDTGLRRLRFVPVAVILYSAAVLPGRAAGFYRNDLHPAWENEIAVGELSAQLSRRLSKDGNRYYVLSLASRSSWQLMAGVVNSLEKRGFPVGMENSIYYMPPPVPDGLLPCTLFIGRLSEEGRLSEHLAAYHDGAGVIAEDL